MSQAIQAPVDHQLVRHLNKGWPKRATVCAVEKFQIDEEFDPSRPDYPPGMVPFFNHPAFQRLDEATKSEVLTWGWIGYNRRTVAAEEYVVNPALAVISSQFLGENDWHFREAMQQTLVDEHYHTLMHMKAVERTKAQRNLRRDLELPRSVTYCRLKALRAELPEQWQRDLASIAFAVVAEISVNAYLDTLAEDTTIQPQNRQVAELHNRDEYAHSKVLAEIGKVMYANMDEERRRFFVRMLPEALRAFVAQDYSMWEAILTQLGIADAGIIIADTKTAAAGGVIMRDYSGLHRFAKELGILGEIDFNFTGTLNEQEGASEPAESR
jgi:hypothetical protein